MFSPVDKMEKGNMLEKIYNDNSNKKKIKMSKLSKNYKKTNYKFAKIEINLDQKLKIYKRKIKLKTKNIRNYNKRTKVYFVIFILLLN